MPVDLTRLSEGWLELESDPGLFTLLLEDFGVEGVQVEEIYDLQKPISESTVYGFIFLFRWIEERRVRRKISEQDECFVRDEDAVNKIFFAQQVVPNSCATHALLSVLLNCPKLQLGNTLTRLKVLTSGMSPENKGWAIGNTPELARAHNSHVSPQARQLKQEKGFALLPSKNRSAGETFHFVSYVPINGRLFELDGLKPYPIDHGPWSETEDWTEKFRRVITERLGIATGGVPYHDIRFNLMAVVPDKRIAFNHKLKILKTNRQIVLEALQQLVKLTHPGLMTAKVGSQGVLSSAVVGPAKKNQPPKVGTAKLASNDKDKPMFVNEYETFLASGLETTFHNYAKSIKSDLKKFNKLEEEPSVLDSKKYLKPDYATPLTVQTSPAHSSSSTDTSSEVGSAFNSPTQGWYHSPNQNSPTPPRDIKKFVVIRVGSQFDNSQVAGELEDVKEIDNKVTSISSKQKSSCNLPSGSICPHQHSHEPHHFAPKDLLALLKHLEQEIANYEGQLKDEVEKRKKFKVDDCRRTHNYDQFICTFLSMLAAEGILADLVRIMVKKRQGLHICRPVKKIKSNDRNHRKRGRPKLKKR